MTWFDGLWLTTLNHVKQHRDLTSAENSDDEFLKTLIQEASADFAQAIGRMPLPYSTTVSFDARGNHISLYTLDVPDLLAITTLTNGDSTTIAGSAYVLESANAYPKWRVRLKETSGVVFTYATNWEQAISIAGWFGYVPHYAQNAFRDSGVDGTLAAAGTTSMNIGQNAALFEVGHYLRMGSELLRVEAVTDNANPTEDTLTLARGELGTTATAHTGVNVEIFTPLQDIRSAVREVVCYRYKKRNALGSRVSVFDGGTVVVEDMDPQVQKTIQRHTPVRIRVV